MGTACRRTGFGVDGDSAITNEGADLDPERSARAGHPAIHYSEQPLSSSSIERERMDSIPQLYGSSHPAGRKRSHCGKPGGNHVIRYNEIFSDSEHISMTASEGVRISAMAEGPAATRTSMAIGSRIAGTRH